MEAPRGDKKMENSAAPWGGYAEMDGQNLEKFTNFCTHYMLSGCWNPGICSETLWKCNKNNPCRGISGWRRHIPPEGFRIALICDIIAPSVNAHDWSQFSESTTLFGEAVWCFSLEIWNLHPPGGLPSVWKYRYNIQESCPGIADTTPGQCQPNSQKKD